MQRSFSGQRTMMTLVRTWVHHGRPRLWVLVSTIACASKTKSADSTVATPCTRHPIPVISKPLPLVGGFIIWCRITGKDALSSREFRLKNISSHPSIDHAQVICRRGRYEGNMQSEQACRRRGGQVKESRAGPARYALSRTNRGPCRRPTLPSLRPR